MRAQASEVIPVVAPAVASTSTVWTCNYEICEESFNSMDELERHQLMVHGELHEGNRPDESLGAGKSTKYFILCIT